MSEPKNIESLDDAMVVQVLENLVQSPAVLCACRCVSTRWRELAGENRIMREES